MNIFQRFYASLRYREAVRMADAAHRQSGHRYYVMPSFGGKRQLLIVDRKNFRTLKQKHYINPNASVHDLIAECFYCTSYNNGDGFLLEQDKRNKYLSFLSWWEAEGKLRRERKMLERNKFKPSKRK